MKVLVAYEGLKKLLQSYIEITSRHVSCVLYLKVSFTVYYILKFIDNKMRTLNLARTLLASSIHSTDHQIKFRLFSTKFLPVNQNLAVLNKTDHNRRPLFARMMSTESPEILSEEVGTKGIIVLNKPKSLNALSENMVKLMYPILKDWEKNKSLVLVKGKLSWRLELFVIKKVTFSLI